ncbi:MAG TPA: aminopeptidase, partial [Polyangiales bacterium]
QHAQDRALFDRAVAEAYDRLDALYVSTLPRAQKLREREQTFAALTERISVLFPREDPSQWRINNARLVHFHRYNANSGVLTSLWNESHRDFRRFWQLAEAYALEQFG